MLGFVYYLSSYLFCIYFIPGIQIRYLTFGLIFYNLICLNYVGLKFCYHYRLNTPYFFQWPTFLNNTGWARPQTETGLARDACRCVRRSALKVLPDCQLWQSQHGSLENVLKRRLSCHQANSFSIFYFHIIYISKLVRPFCKRETVSSPFTDFIGFSLVTIRAHLPETENQEAETPQSSIHLATSINRININVETGF